MDKMAIKSVVVIFVASLYFAAENCEHLTMIYETEIPVLQTSCNKA